MRKNIDITKDATPEQIAMLKKARDIQITEEDEYPEFTETELREFKRISSDRNALRKKQAVTIRISPQAMNRAKALGKGYTSVLGRIIESTLEDPKEIKKYL